MNIVGIPEGKINAKSRELVWACKSEGEKKRLNGETVESFSLSYSWWLSPKMFPPAKESIIFEQKTTKGFFKLCDYITAIVVFVAVAVAVAAAVVGELVCRCRYGYWCRCKTICVHCTLSACTLYSALLCASVASTFQLFAHSIPTFDFHISPVVILTTFQALRRLFIYHSFLVVR